MADGGKVLATASSLDTELRETLSNGGNVKAAAVVGKRIADKAREKGIEAVAFDRCGLSLSRPGQGAGGRRA